MYANNTSNIKCIIVIKFNQYFYYKNNFVSTYQLDNDVYLIKLLIASYSVQFQDINEFI